MSGTLQHATITLDHRYSAGVERIYSEFADPQARAKWSVSSNDALVYDQADFREGGRDVFRCGPKDDLRLIGLTIYHVIDSNRCVISSEILAEGNTRLAVALNTLEFTAEVTGSILKVTIQIASFGGPGLIKGYEDGNRCALEGLARHLGEL